MVIKEKCTNCGKMAEMTHEFWFRRESLTETRLRKFCYECGCKVERILEEGVN